MSPARSRSIALLTCVAVLQPAAAGCAAGTHSEAPIAVVSNIGEREVIGRTVTVSGKIIEVLTPTSFVMAADEPDDRSLLVLSRGSPGLAKGQIVTFDGNVQKFVFDAYREQYGLADQQAYAPFEGEKFIVMLPGSSVTTPSARPPG